MKNKSTIKTYYKKFKEIWAIPKYRAIIKLSLYGIMFLLLIIISNLNSNQNQDNIKDDNNKSYAEILTSTDLKNLNLKYTININAIMYTIEGNIKNNILEGYIEYNGLIKKIKIDSNNIYNIANNIETVDEELNNMLVKDFLFPSKIFELIENESSFIEKGEDITIYTYEIYYNNILSEITLTSNLEKFTNINIKTSNAEYNLVINFDKYE